MRRPALSARVHVDQEVEQLALEDQERRREDEEDMGFCDEREARLQRDCDETDATDAFDAAFDRADYECDECDEDDEPIDWPDWLPKLE